MNQNESRYIKIKEASRITGLGLQMLRSMADEKKIRCYKTPGGTRMFDKQSLEELCFNILPCQEVSEMPKKNIIYARVSSKKQLDDLSRQIDFIKSSKPQYSSYHLISDIGSGINFKRKGLSNILDFCKQQTIGEIVVAHRDRLSRFAFDLIELIVSKSGGKITVINKNDNSSTEQELAEDLMSIVHIYCCRQMGKRKYKSK
jgi:excisionase family DNA binding protein